MLNEFSGIGLYLWLRLSSRWLLRSLPLAVLYTHSAVAQIAPDQTLGSELSTLNPDGIISGQPALLVEGGSRRDINLFHSFREFNIVDGQRVYFANPTGVQNILTRITGTNPSNILGTLGVNGSANLFLINPNGIVFGNNARLDVSGSFVATTANALQFDNQGFFSATNPEVPALLTINPSVFFFNQLTPGRIENRSEPSPGLSVPNGRSLLLVGGEILMDQGSLTAPGGRVELGASSGQESVELSLVGNEWRLTFLDSARRSNVSLTNGALVNVRAGESGNVAINAFNLTMTGVNTQVLAGISAGSGSINAQLGNVEVNATESVNLNGSLIINNVTSNSVGSTGGITIASKSLTLTNGANIRAGTAGQGSSGDVTISVKDSISLDGVNSVTGSIFPTSSAVFNVVSAAGEGASGDIFIKANSLSVTNGAVITTNLFGKGRAGNITVDVKNAILVNGESPTRFPRQSNINSAVASDGVGDGGDIQITTGTLSLTNGGSVTSTHLGRRGNAGTITINARDTVSLSGLSNRRFASGISSDIAEGDSSVKNGGGVLITTETLSLADGSNISSSNYNTPGRAGSILLNARTVNLSGSYSNGAATGLFTTTTGVNAGAAGNIYITADALRIVDGAVINALSNSSEHAGNITVDVNTLALISGGGIIANASSHGDAGNIVISANDSVTIAGSNPISLQEPYRADVYSGSSSEFSGLFANTLPNSTGNSGSIFIDPKVLIVRDGGRISVDSQGAGRGGDIQVQADKLILDDQGSINAETASNQGGNITLQLKDYLLSRHASFISSTAGTAQADGDGGNISITAPFVIAVPTENTDITANAFRGAGGNIRITATGLYGLAFRPNQTALSDITASSTVGVQGVVQIDTPDLDLSRSLLELPIQVVDASNLINQDVCRISGRNSEFIVTGRGGLPSSPGETTTPASVWEDWRVEEPSLAVASSSSEAVTSPAAPPPSLIVEAQGWRVDASGDVVLVAESSTSTPYTPWNNLLHCHS